MNATIGLIGENIVDFVLTGETQAEVLETGPAVIAELGTKAEEVDHDIMLDVKTGHYSLSTYLEIAPSERALLVAELESKLRDRGIEITETTGL